MIKLSRYKLTYLEYQDNKLSPYCNFVLKIFHWGYYLSPSGKLIVQAFEDFLFKVNALHYSVYDKMTCVSRLVCLKS